jgi:hypothetical protein
LLEGRKREEHVTVLKDVSSETYAISTVKNSHARAWKIYIETID